MLRDALPGAPDEINKIPLKTGAKNVALTAIAKASADRVDELQGLRLGIGGFDAVFNPGRVYPQEGVLPSDRPARAEHDFVSLLNIHRDSSACEPGMKDLFSPFSTAIPQNVARDGLAQPSMK